MFVWLTFFALDAGHRFGAVAILAIVAANTVFFGGLAVFVTRARRVPVELAALACAAVFSVWNDNHDVQLLDRPATRRRASGSERGVFVVGHARAGRGRQADPGDRRRRGRRRHSRGVLDVARPASPRRHSRCRRAVSASGCLRSAACRAAASAPRSMRGCAAIPPATPPRAQIASEILQERFLAPMVAQAGLRRSAAVVPAGADRARSIDRARWRRRLPRPTTSTCSTTRWCETFTEFRPVDADDVPVLLLNSTSVQLGRRVVASPYPWPLADVSVEEQDPIDFHELTGRDVSVATAVHNTARFPYISAAGRLRAKNGENLGHLVDGGYFENTGADTLIDLLRYLKQSASPLSVRFIVVVARSTTPPEEHLTDPTRIPWRDTASLGEVFSPLRALLQTRTRARRSRAAAAARVGRARRCRRVPRLQRLGPARSAARLATVAGNGGRARRQRRRRRASSDQVAEAQGGHRGRRLALLSSRPATIECMKLRVIFGGLAVIWLAGVTQFSVSAEQGKRVGRRVHEGTGGARRGRVQGRRAPSATATTWPATASRPR